MIAKSHFDLYAEFAEGKKRRGLVNPCAGCLRSGAKPHAFAKFASADRPVVVEYHLCKTCAKKLHNPRRRKQLAATVEENLEALGAFELGLSRGEA